MVGGTPLLELLRGGGEIIFLPKNGMKQEGGEWGAVSHIRLMYKPLPHVLGSRQVISRRALGVISRGAEAKQAALVLRHQKKVFIPNEQKTTLKNYLKK